MALVPADDGGWEVREELDLNATSAPSLLVGSDQASSFEAVRRIEFLRRAALLRWDRRGEPETRAHFFASYAREEIERRLLHDAESIEKFGAMLADAVGLKVEDKHPDPLRLVAELLVASAMLELVRMRLPKIGGIVDAGVPEPLRQWLAWPAVSPALRRMLDEIPALVEPTAGGEPVDSEGEESAANPATAVDRRLVQFCLTFWKAIASATRSREGFDAKHGYSVDDQARDLLSACSIERGDEFTFLDMNAGIGDHLAAVVRQVPDRVKSATLVICEANPFGLQVARLRLAAMAAAIQANRDGVGLRASIRPYLHNAFRDGLPHQAIPTPEGLVVGEWRPHLGQGMTLELDGTRHVSHTWGHNLYSRDLRPLFSEPAKGLFELKDRDNRLLIASAGMTKDDGGAPAWFGRLPGDYDFFAGHSRHFPVWLDGGARANLSPDMRA